MSNNVSRAGVWVRHELSDQNKAQRSAVCASLLPRQEQEPFLRPKKTLIEALRISTGQQQPYRLQSLFSYDTGLEQIQPTAVINDPSELQQTLKKLKVVSEEVGLTMNIEKTKVMTADEQKFRCTIANRKIQTRIKTAAHDGLQEESPTTHLCNASKEGTQSLWLTNNTLKRPFKKVVKCNSEVFPPQQKIAGVITIPKSTQNIFSQSYQPSNLVRMMSKNAEWIIL
ncbi:hypothetical protein ILUMI_06326, partial [Ignelater luminosus]